MVLRWIAGFASLANCFASTAPGVRAAMASASARACVMPLVGSVSTSSAPNALRSMRRSFDIDAGIVRITL